MRECLRAKITWLPELFDPYRTPWPRMCKISTKSPGLEGDNACPPRQSLPPATLLEPSAWPALTGHGHERVIRPRRSLLRALVSSSGRTGRRVPTRLPHTDTTLILWCILCTCIYLCMYILHRCLLSTCIAEKVLGHSPRTDSTQTVPFVPPRAPRAGQHCQIELLLIPSAFF